MKKVKLFAVFALLFVCATSYAQFANSSSASSTTASAEEWSTFWVEWNPSSFEPSKGDGQSFTGISVGYSKSFGVSSNLPLFVEGGLGLQYSFYSEEDYDITEKLTMFSVKVPVNLVYRYNLPNSTVSLCPFAGVTLRYNLSGNMKYEYEDEDDYYDDEEDYEYNLFDKDDMGSKDATWKRFQIGWQIGAKAIFNNKLSLAVSYGSDFSEIVKKTKVKTTTISLGFVF